MNFLADESCAGACRPNAARGRPSKRQKQERGIRASTEPCSGTRVGADRRVPGRIPRFFWRGLERFRPFRQRCGLRPPIPEHPGWYPNSGRSSDSRREPEWPLPRLPRGALAASWEAPSQGIIAEIRELGGATDGDEIRLTPEIVLRRQASDSAMERHTTQ